MTLTLIKLKIKMILNNIFGGSKSGLQKGLMIFAFLYFGIAFVVIFAGIFVIISEPYEALGLKWLYYGLSGALAFGLCFIGSIFTAKNHLFDSKDNELLLSMPIPQSKILISRLITIMIFNALSAVTVYIGTVIGTVIGYGFDIITLLLLTVSYMIIILFSTALTAVFSFALAWIGSKIKFKKIATLLVTFTLFFLYMAVMLNMNSVMKSIADNGSEIGEAIKTYGAPMYLMGKGIADLDMPAFLGFFLWAAIPFAIVYILLVKTYYRIITTKKSSAKVKYKEGNLNVKSGFAALFHKEVGRVFGTPMLLFNYGTGTLFMIIGAVYLLIKKDSLEDVVSLLSVYGVHSTALLGRAAAFFLGFMSMTVGSLAASSINLEGRTLWILRTVPVDERSILKAKGFAPLVIGIPGVLIASAMTWYALSLDLLTGIIMIAFPMSLVIISSFSSLLINLYHYKFDWVNESYAYKQAAAPMISSFAGMGYMATFLLLYIFIFSHFINLGTYLAVFTGLQLIGAIVLLRVLMTTGVKQFRRLKF